MSLEAKPLAAKRLSQQDRILLALHEAGPKGCTTEELSKLALRFGGRIYDLRQKGWIIKSSSMPGTESELYVLVRAVAQVPQPDLLQPQAPARPVAPMLVGVCTCAHMKAHHAHGTGYCRDCLCSAFEEPGPEPEPSLF